MTPHALKAPATKRRDQAIVAVSAKGLAARPIRATGAMGPERVATEGAGPEGAGMTAVGMGAGTVGGMTVEVMIAVADPVAMTAVAALSGGMTGEGHPAVMIVGPVEMTVGLAVMTIAVGRPGEMSGAATIATVIIATVMIAAAHAQMIAEGHAETIVDLVATIVGLVEMTVDLAEMTAGRVGTAVGHMAIGRTDHAMIGSVMIGPATIGGAQAVSAGGSLARWWAPPPAKWLCRC